ncbi:conserved hypothetical protein [Paraburkholderia sabiae]|uniref:hypothetical protein n=1 Tax=Paraburkholderia sabiae TaxID=273251 RepID=UPI001CAEB496|nr:hypothetical protein [Paraburkholderia sabiae]CAG9226226.1 conserved hypothetical protein [Paraburkholderia sabiae]
MISFITDIRPLFRDSDIATMKKRVLLSDVNSVSAAADKILARLVLGDMPCDEPWSDEKIRLFAQWIADGKNP